MTAAIRLEVAREKVAELPTDELNQLADSDECWRKAFRVGVPFHKLEMMVRRERFKRGLLTLADLPPEQRRELIDPAELDLHAIAAGPIMDIGKLYLPAGKISMEETRAREAATILSAQGMARGSAETEGLRPLRAAKPGPKDAPEKDSEKTIPTPQGDHP